MIWRPVTVASNWEGFFSLPAWQIVAIPGGENYHPLYGPLLIFEVLGNTVVFGLNALALCLFFAKRKPFPKVYIAFLATNAIFVLLDEIAGNAIPSVAAAAGHDSSSNTLGRALVQAFIWISYMLKSRRVKATFVR
jgi:hypothetical protein